MLTFMSNLTRVIPLFDPVQVKMVLTAYALSFFNSLMLYSTQAPLNAFEM